MNWFIEMFADVSDRVKFFAIVISSFIAISAILLNQHLNRNASRRTLNIEKIEELYNHLTNFRGACFIYLQKLYTKEKETDELRRLLQDCFEHIRAAEVISELHFEHIKVDSLEIQRLMLVKYNALIPTRYLGGDDWYERQQMDFDEIKEIYDKLAIKCKKEMKCSRH